LEFRFIHYGLELRFINVLNQDTNKT